MHAINIDNIQIDGTHGISLLPRDARGSLNGIRSETFCSKIRKIHGIWPGPELGPGPGLPDRARDRPRAALGQAQARPSFMDPIDFLPESLSTDSVQGSPGVSGQERNAIGAINLNNINIGSMHAVCVAAQGHA